MRDAFMQALLDLAKHDPRILLLTGDLGFGVLNEFRRECPDQFLNVGVAEQNLGGVGAGLALTGRVVFTYSIGNFPTLRCLEQIRNDVCYHAANVKVVTVGGGVAYGSLGYTHHAVEDLAIMRALPGLAVVAPGDPVEVEQLVPQIVQHAGPVYLRLGRAGEQRVHSADVRVTLGRATMAREGDDVALLTTGGMLPVALEAAAGLASDGVSAAVASFHAVAPLDEEAVLELAERCGVLVTCEEHSVVGGFGSAVAEVLAEQGTGLTFRRFGFAAARPPHGVGSQEYIRRANGLDADALAGLVRSLVPLKSRP